MRGQYSSTTSRCYVYVRNVNRSHIRPSSTLFYCLASLSTQCAFFADSVLSVEEINDYSVFMLFTYLSTSGSTEVFDLKKKTEFGGLFRTVVSKHGLVKGHLWYLATSISPPALILFNWATSCIRTLSNFRLPAAHIQPPYRPSAGCIHGLYWIRGSRSLAASTLAATKPNGCLIVRT